MNRRRCPQAGRPRASEARLSLGRLGLTCLLAFQIAASTGLASADTGPSGAWAGKSLAAALQELQALGLNVIFASSLVRPEMKVEEEPSATEPRRILDEILAPHGLIAREGPGGSLVVTRHGGVSPQSSGSILGRVLAAADRAPVASARVRVVGWSLEASTAADGGFALPLPGTEAFTLEARAPGFLSQRLDAARAAMESGQEIEILLSRAPLIREELVVTPSRLTLLREEPVGSLGLSREEILSLPHLGDDFFRALTLLPGLTANDVSAQFHVRGARRDETQVLLDGQELFEAFHLKDYDNALSFVAPGTLGSADLVTGGFTVEYGDRMSGVLNMTTATPELPLSGRIGIGILSAEAGGAGLLAGGRGSWLAEVRRGSIDLLGKLLGDEDPQYWDAFAKLDYQLGPGSGLRLNLLHSKDELEFEELLSGESQRLETDYRSSYLWLTHRAILGERLLVESAVAGTWIDRERGGEELEENVGFRVQDMRETEVYGLRQGWSFQASSRQQLRWGFDLRDFETRYNYFNSYELDSPLARLRHRGTEEESSFRGLFDDRYRSFYLSDRVRASARLTAELGARAARTSVAEGYDLDPRLNLVWALDESSVMRAAWGRFSQSQRSYELQVEDGDSRFYPVEHSEHRILGYEKLIGGGPDSGSRGVALRVELYQRLVDNPRARYENLFEPINFFPELEPDRVLVAPDRSLAEGVELFVRGAAGDKIRWWVNYSYASSEDKISQDWVSRSVDQTHSLNLDLDCRLSDRWRLNLAWRYHTGWPTTPLGLEVGEDEEGEVELDPVLGPPNSSRLADYHRLDLRASRRWSGSSGNIVLYFDVQNLYNRKNLAGFDIEVDEESGTLVRNEERFAGIIPSAGLRFEF